MLYKLVRHKAAPPGHVHFKGRTIYDPSEIAKIEADAHLARTYQRAALTPDEAEYVASLNAAKPDVSPVELGEPIE